MSVTAVSRKRMPIIHHFSLEDKFNILTQVCHAKNVNYEEKLRYRYNCIGEMMYGGCWSSEPQIGRGL